MHRCAPAIATSHPLPPSGLPWCQPPRAARASAAAVMSASVSSGVMSGGSRRWIACDRRRQLGAPGDVVGAGADQVVGRRRVRHLIRRLAGGGGLPPAALHLVRCEDDRHPGHRASPRSWPCPPLPRRAREALARAVHHSRMIPWAARRQPAVGAGISMDSPGTSGAPAGPPHAPPHARSGASPTRPRPRPRPARRASAQTPAAPAAPRRPSAGPGRSASRRGSGIHFPAGRAAPITTPGAIRRRRVVGRRHPTSSLWSGVGKRGTTRAARSHAVRRAASASTAATPRARRPRAAS